MKLCSIPILFEFPWYVSSASRNGYIVLVLELHVRNLTFSIEHHMCCIYYNISIYETVTPEGQWPP